MKNSSAFYYKNNMLFCDGVPVTDIIKKTGTPAYLYSKGHFLSQLQLLQTAFAGLPHRIFYASKANFNTHIIRLFHEAGCGVDVNSAGEMHRALKAGVPAKDMIFAGVGKTPAEIELALKKNLLLIKAESAEELSLINRAASRMKKTPRVALRVNPDVDARTHPHISTGLANNKFGISMKEAKELFLSKRFRNVRFTGIDMHLGSQITSVEPYLEASEKIVALVKLLGKKGVALEHIDLGGGFGVPYKGDEHIDLPRLATELKSIFGECGADLFFEPGRFLTANGGILVTSVLYNKVNGTKHFVVVDAAMNDLLRPALYGAYHGILPVKKKQGETREVDVVGPVCESSDAFARGRQLPAVRHGDLLAITSAGAYGMVMSSNYNARLRPPEILVCGNTFRVIRRREQFSDLTEPEE